MVARREYRRRLAVLGDNLLRAGDRSRLQLSRAVDVAVGGDPAAVDWVVAEHDQLRTDTAGIRDETIQLLALQSPVADELRLLAAVLDVVVRLDGIGGLAVEVARAARPGDPDQSEPLVQQCTELGMLVDRLIGRALERFGRRRPDDGELAVAWGHLDVLRGHLHERLVETGRACPERVDWVVRVTLAASWLAQAGQHGLAIARHVPHVTGTDPPRLPPD